MPQANAAALTEVTPTEALACLRDARHQFEQRHGTGAEQPLHGALASVLFPVAEKDYKRAARGEPYRPTPKKLRGVLESMKKARTFAESSFKGNKRIQLDLQRALLELLPFRARDGRLLCVVGPEHKRGGAMNLYLTVREIVEPEPVCDDPSPPVDEHAQRVQHVATLISAWFVKELLPWSPTAVRRLEQHARKRGVLYALAAFFGFVACTGWIAWEYRYMTDGSIRAAVVPGVPPNGEASTVAAAAMLWVDDHASPDDVYVIYKDGKRVAEVIARTAWLPAEQKYMWVDPEEMPIGEDHTYRLAKKLFKLKAIDVTTAMDLKPCWKCLMDAARGRLEGYAHDATALGGTSRELYAVSGMPVRYGGRLDLKGVPPDPLSVPPPTKVEVDFGDRHARSILDSNNIVHTYLKPGRYVIQLHPLDDRYITPAPVEVRVVASRRAIPVHTRLIPLTPMAKDGQLPIALAALPNEPTAVPLEWWLTLVSSDLGGDYLENLTLGISYGDKSEMEFVKLRDVIRKTTANRYEVIKDVRHTWPENGGKEYMLEMFAYSQEQGTTYFTAAPVIILNRFSFLPYITRSSVVGRGPVFWYLDLSERENYANAQVGQAWSASLDPWLNAIRGHLGVLPARLELYVDYGDRYPKRSTSLSLGPAVFPQPGSSWTKFMFKDPERNFYYVGETKVEIR
jgi:hypothetical protein